ncbi:hypothetical protein H072_4124 [Dactylellina haptotyla CBS 200.50]|uniref:Beta-lactamase-related domain-containing protein n=1 Tax=Dactylellina haptotyla (strain CBS 200.50) TaxID=1284197 RepID=S8BR55_DACHA|nr:hypothetical protein H072_4124 [Dactylellina haptotyla CBS 200.50]
MDEEKRRLFEAEEDRSRYQVPSHRRLQRRDVVMATLRQTVATFVGMALAIVLVGPYANLAMPSTAQRWLAGALVPTSSATHPEHTYAGLTLPTSNENAAEFVWKCVPPPPPFLLQDPRIVENPAVVSALASLQLVLRLKTAPYNDAFAVSIVHASKGKIFEFHKGRVRTNESATDSPDLVDGDSIFRIASITKAFVVLEALILSRQARLRNFKPELTLGSRLQEVLPEFKLPAGFEDEEASITLADLGSHMAGLGRDIGELQLNSLNDIVFPPVNGSDLFDDFPHNRTYDELLDLIADKDLIWQVGEVPSYSNTGFSLLGMAVVKYYNKLFGTSKDFTAILQEDIFTPLAMNHSFTGPIPPHLRKHVTVPNAKNFVDKVFAPAHDPAGGIFSSPNDLSSLLHKVLLSQIPKLISPSQRLTWLRAHHQFTDGLSSVGIPWETYRAIMPDYSTHNLYFKGGGLPSQVSQISTFPDYGYGVIALTSIGLSDDELHKGGNFSDPGSLSFEIHNILAPAIWAAYNEILIADYVGIYVSGDGFAKVVFKEGMLVIDQFFAKGVDVLLKWDEMIWTEVGKRRRLYDTGAKLIGTAFDGQFRTTLMHGCAWTGFDAMTTKGGWGFDKIVIKKDEAGKTALFYEPMNNAKLYKVT